MNAVETYVRKSRRWLSRSEWLIRLLRLTKAQGAASEPGLVLIQIDGLSRHQLEAAMAKGHLPFLARLLRQHRYELYSLYSGLPSSTPAVTAELLYGVKCAVPSFSFYSRSTRTLCRMFDPRCAKEIDQRLRAQGPPLLAGGSAYASIYTGGAEETHVCAATSGLDDLFRVRYPMRLIIVSVLSLYSLVRVGVLMMVEFVLALFDCIRGSIAGQDLWKEIKFIPSRVGVSILMREMATVGAKIDVTRGLPVVYVDMVGYDEQSHRRGPTSRFAHWSLKGIDDAISRIWKAARRSSQRDYDVWVFSDHGNEWAVSYVHQNGRALEQAVAEVFDGTVSTPVEEHSGPAVQPGKTSRYVGGGSNIRPWGPSWRGPGDRRRDMPRSRTPPTRERGGQDSRAVQPPVVAAMGPVGHVYVDRTLSDVEREHFAKSLVEQAKIPMVAVRDGSDHVCVWTAAGEFVLPDDASRVFAPDHPFLKEVSEDFMALCRHPDAGDFVIWGWSRDGPPMTFRIENGAHAGPGLEETHAFALLPDDAPLYPRAKKYLRLLDLRKAALRHLRRDVGSPVPLFPNDVVTDVLRVMTYNVHSCVGIDGKLSPHRIARVIARYRPDVVALQEVDVGRARTDQADQAELIAEYLNMDYHFHPTIRVAEESYGDCLLSRLPMCLLKTGRLPTLPDRDSLEPRGALWVAVKFGGGAIQVLNTHLGLNGKERLLQIQSLLGANWLGRHDGSSPVILCGDFNASPQSAVWRLCMERFEDVQTKAPDCSPRRTWFGHYPVARIDHIFVNARVEAVRVDVGDDYLARVASDHRPLFAELRVRY